ncbi:MULTISPECIES: hypothetical protein [Acidianus]|uniref:ArsA HSP20-like domain-containing protein n=1 Tax=Candidatus Acidianus copahuensis TaxID=1160895 RepID=A0A031LR57_9CREN|nr:MULTISPECIES: hypothetical protein [Acidianus]EZQ06869.1 hypothetical protein CM19_05725 [Candidatus Acidianus copahuensis]NON61348.1 hypothetical protein [Acidianus sp. RZ1]
MPAYRDLYDMVKRMIEGEEKKVEEIEREMREEIEREFEEPLYTRSEENEKIYYVIDVPFLDPNTLYVKVENKKIELKCEDKMKRKHSLLIHVKEDISSYDVQVIRNKGFIKLVLLRRTS